MTIPHPDPDEFVPDPLALLAISVMSVTPFDRKILGIICRLGRETYPDEVFPISGHVKVRVQVSFRRLIENGLIIKRPSRGYKHHNVRWLCRPDPYVPGILGSLNPWRIPRSQSERGMLDRELGMAVYCKAYRLVMESIWPSQRLLSQELEVCEARVRKWTWRLKANSHLGLWPDTSSVSLSGRSTAVIMRAAFRRRKRNAAKAPDVAPWGKPKLGRDIDRLVHNLSLGASHDS